MYEQGMLYCIIPPSRSRSGTAPFCCLFWPAHSESVVCSDEHKVQHSKQAANQCMPVYASMKATCHSNDSSVQLQCAKKRAPHAHYDTLFLKHDCNLKAEERVHHTTTVA
eukprot:21406-Heterococcus_DN1.PRE.4